MDIRMNVDRLNRLLGLFANFGVLAGIIFLAFELNQNTVATRLEAASNFNASFSEISCLSRGIRNFLNYSRRVARADSETFLLQINLDWSFFIPLYCGSGSLRTFNICPMRLTTIFG
jgi:hypothetical protein